ncbi:replication protein RepA [Microbacterium sp. SL62]|uniref:replication protein RepA n=1 Tax=Microbacterium sp. SL62 TaxID=2995139 RepID=UPI00227283A6|nr:replication protein RepA [Microbacterium sp. SL62]MCY1718477.1 replication protein RepA [Microbacterium sp. SL62]
MADDSIGYSARMFAQVSLPQRNPGDRPYIERTDGNLTLTLRPGYIKVPGEKAGEFELVQKYPFGVYPRLALTYVSTEAFLSKSPVVDLGHSMRSFLSKLGVEYSGKTNRLVKEQLAALFSAQLTLTGTGHNAAGRGTITQFVNVAEKYSLWWANEESEGVDGLWGSTVRLDDKFYNSIVKEPVPVDLRALRTLGGSPLRIDLYLWATYRVQTLEAPALVTWAELYTQFGSQYGRPRAFKSPFIKALDEVKAVYPQLNVEVAESGVTLHPTLSRITSKRSARQVGSKSAGAA